MEVKYWRTNREAPAAAGVAIEVPVTYNIVSVRSNITQKLCTYIHDARISRMAAKVNTLSKCDILIIIESSLPVIVTVLQEFPASPLDMADTSESPGATKSGLNLWYLKNKNSI